MLCSSWQLCGFVSLNSTRTKLPQVSTGLLKTFLKRFSSNEGNPQYQLYTSTLLWKERIPIYVSTRVCWKLVVSHCFLLVWVVLCVWIVSCLGRLICVNCQLFGLFNLFDLLFCAKYSTSTGQVHKLFAFFTGTLSSQSFSLGLCLLRSLEVVSLYVFRNRQGSSLKDKKIMFY